MKLAKCPYCGVLHEAVGRSALAGADQETAVRITQCALCEAPSDQFVQVAKEVQAPGADDFGYPRAVVPWIESDGSPSNAPVAPSPPGPASTHKLPAANAVPNAQALELLDIRLDGRRWSASEMSRHDALPGRLEMVGGKLCINEAQRMLLLGALLEHVGTARAVSIGPLDAWRTALEKRIKREGGGS